MFPAAAPGFELRHTTLQAVPPDSSDRPFGSQLRQSADPANGQAACPPAAGRVLAAAPGFEPRHTTLQTVPPDSSGTQFRQTASTDCSGRPFSSQLRQTTSIDSSDRPFGSQLRQRKALYCGQPLPGARVIHAKGLFPWMKPVEAPSHPRWYRNKIVTKTLYLHNIIVNLYQDNLLLTLQLTNPMSLSQDKTEPFGFQIANTLGFYYTL